MEAFLMHFLGNMPTIAVILVGVISLFSLGKGADILVDHAVSVSQHFNIPKAIIGATIISLGTTLPEASVSVLAAVQGVPDLALGNAIGSIIVDTGLIVGIVSQISPLPIDINAIRFQSWTQLAVGVLIVVFSLPFWHPGSVGNISQWMGIVMLLMLAAYLYRSMKQSGSTAYQAEEIVTSENIILDFVLIVVGIAIVIIASKVLIPSVEVLALRAGIPQSVIAATLVAFGTSLPELTTAIKSVTKGHSDLALGNIMGADILNVLFVVGAAATVTKEGLVVPSNFYSIHLPFLMIILVLFRIFTLNSGDRISRMEGMVLLVCYIIYLAFNYGPALLA
ncbi:MAG: cation:H+ antiporter [Clostridiales bacterium]|jgi:cation:H+ antiporter|nr:cation:H+ antiporter [Clostridiales bacterium]MDN5299940.1 cation:H+ antiporter [Clostridiales bacterium]